MSKTSKQYTAAQKEKFAQERKDKLEAVAGKLQSGIVSFQTSDTFKDYLRAASKFHRYSFFNTTLIWLQNREATRVASYTTWKKLGRTVKKGEKGLAILRPNPFQITVKDRDTDEDVTRRIMRFAVAYVFDISQTEGADIPTIEYNWPAGDGGQFVYDGLARLCETEGIMLTTDEKYNLRDGSKGYYMKSTKRIYIHQGPMEQMAMALVHELGHHFDPELEKGTSAEKETIAQASAFLVMEHFGLDCSDITFKYIGAWAKASKPEEILKKIMGSALGIAHRLIEAIEGNEGNEEAESEEARELEEVAV